MFDLERLYDSAHKHLSKRNQDWDGFAQDFSNIFSSHMAIYCTPPNNEKLDLNSTNELLATTDKALVEEFFAKGINELDHMFEDNPNPLEPFRRTDHMSDEEYREHEITKLLLKNNDVFYLMVVYAILPNGFPLVLFLWRGENEKDFSDIEKQRITLFMRHLATLVTSDGVNVDFAKIIGAKPSKEIIAFGEKYSLTKTEIKILSSLINGNSLRMIADELDRSYGTIRWHVQNILAKCQVKNQKNLLNEFYALIKR